MHAANGSSESKPPTQAALSHLARSASHNSHMPTTAPTTARKRVHHSHVRVGRVRVGRVYFLWKNNELVYIGSTFQKIDKRLGRHVHAAEYDRVTWIEVKGRTYTTWVESYLIARLRPRLNIRVGHLAKVERTKRRRSTIDVVLRVEL